MNQRINTVAGAGVLRIVAAALVTCLLLGLAVTGFRQMLADYALGAAQRAPAMAQQRFWYARARAFRPTISEIWRDSAEAVAPEAPTEALALARVACRLDGSDWQNWRTLGLIAYQDNQPGLALNALQQAARLDSGFSAHFQLANMAFLLGDQNEYWREMRQALGLAPADAVVPTLERIAALTGYSPARVLAVLPPQRTLANIQAISFVLGQHDLATARRLWQRLPCPSYRQAACQSATIALVSALLHAPLAAAGRPPAGATPSPGAAAMAVWNQAVGQGWLKAPRQQFGGIADGHFQYPWLGTFFWRVNSNGQVALNPAPAPISGNLLRLRLDGTESEALAFASTWMPVQPGAHYQIGLQARGLQSPIPKTGIELALSVPGQPPFWRLATDLSDRWQQFQGAFMAPDGASALALTLLYARPNGQPLMRGTVEVGALQGHQTAPPPAALVK